MPKRMPKYEIIKSAIAPRIAAASRLIGIRRGCSTMRRKNANAMMTSTSPQKTSMVA